MLTADGIFFQADLLGEPTIHQSRNAASKRLVPSAVLGVGPHDLDNAASGQVVRPKWLHNLSYRQERAQGVGVSFGRRRNIEEGIQATRGTLRYLLKLAVLAFNGLRTCESNFVILSMNGMRKIRLLAIILGVCTVAQSDPPALIRVIRNISPNAAAIQPYVNARAAAQVLGLRSVSGLQETWLIEEHDSYRSEEAVKGLPKARYLVVTIYRIRPGTDAGFAELVRLRRARYDTINLDRPEICYQVVSGAPSGTFIFVTPMNSLKSMDEGLARTPAYAEAIRDANATAGRKIASETEIGHESLIFRLDPSISYVADDFAAEDPGFWSPKPKEP